MKLSHYISLRIMALLFIIICVWSTLFYYGITREVNDETDDVLEDYSTMLIQRSLAGESMPSVDNGSNSTYNLEEVSEEFANNNPVVSYTDEKRFIEYKSEKEPARVIRRIFKAPGDKYYRLTVATPSLDKMDMVFAIMYLMIILYALLFVVILLTNIYVVYRSTKPLRELLSWLENKDIDKISDYFNVETKILEFSALSRSINKFAKRNSELFEKQKEFVANASHELQTPIAVCQNKLELLIESELTSEQVKVIGESLETLKDISRLNRSLLLLSRIDNGDFSSSKVDLRALVSEGLENCSEIYSKNSTLEWESQGECELVMDPSLAQIMINNLVKNAFMHSTQNSKILVSLSSKEFKITNTGLDVSLNKNRIFDRFSNASRQKSSTGLGLAIVGAICNLYGYDIQYSFQEKQHTFSIKFS